MNSNHKDKSENTLSLSNYKEISNKDIEAKLKDIYMNKNLKRASINDEETLKKIFDEKSSIDPEMEVLFYKTYPIIEEMIEFGDLDQSKLYKKKWKDLVINEKKYYIYHKTKIIESRTREKEKIFASSEQKLEDKRKIIDDINEDIANKEQDIKYDDLKDDFIRRRNQISKIERQIQDFPIVSAELEEKIKNCEMLISNYSNDDHPIEKIIVGLKEEKKRLKALIQNETDKIKMYEDSIKQLDESISILSMKPNATEDDFTMIKNK